jgi:hypothetical protein
VYKNLNLRDSKIRCYPVLGDAKFEFRCHTSYPILFHTCFDDLQCFVWMSLINCWGKYADLITQWGTYGLYSTANMLEWLNQVGCDGQYIWLSWEINAELIFAERPLGRPR